MLRRAKKYSFGALHNLVIFSQKNPLLLILLALSTFYFVYQHIINFNWDFAAYVLNARYMFYGGNYFELYRAPLTYFLLAPLVVFGVAGESIYIFLVSILFLYGNVKLSDAIFSKSAKISREHIRFIFYFFSMGGFVLAFGFLTGSELLNLALLELFLAYVLSGKISGHFLGLAFLARYNSIMFFPIMFFYKDYKKIVKNILLFLGVIFPWFLYNFLVYGNWFASFIDSYTLNIHLRDYLFQNFHVSMLYALINWFVVFLIIGLAYSSYILFRKWNLSRDKFVIGLFLIVGILVFYEFSHIPLKFVRYLFNLSLVVAFFSSLGVIFLIKRFNKYKKIIIALLMLSFIITFAGMVNEAHKNQVYNIPFEQAAEDIFALNITECEILSPHWVPMNYITGNVRPLGRNDLSTSIKSNKAALIFTGVSTIDDLFNMNKLDDYPHLIKRDRYVILANGNLSNTNCIKAKHYSERVTNSPCVIVGEKMEEYHLGGISRKICEVINFN